MTVSKEFELFMGFQLSIDFSNMLDKVPAEMRDLYINDKADYLTKVKCNNETFLGKPCGNLKDFESLELLEKNITSLVKKLVPDYPKKFIEIVLFPLEKN